MAPKGGKGGGGGGGGGGISVNGCPGAFSSQLDGYGIFSTPIPYFAAYCIFWLVTLIIIIAWFRVKKRHANARNLVGGIYGTSLLFQLIGYTLIIIASVLRECRVGSIYDYYNWAIAYSVFFRLSTYLLLVVVLWGVNSVLRDQLGNHPSFFKIIYGAILGIVGVVMASYLGIQCYNIWLNTDDGQETDGDSLGFEQERIAVAYWALYLIAVVVSGALSMMAVISLRSRRLGGNLLGWIIALTFTMFLWTLFYVIELGANLQSNFLGINTYYAFEYIIDLFQSASWIILLIIAKSAVFKAPVDNNDPQIYNQPTYPATQQQPVYQQVPQQQQYAYDNGNGTQQYYYQQPPVQQQNVQPKVY